MSGFAGNIPRKLFSFCHLSFAYSAHILPEQQEAENCQNVPQIDEVNIVVVGVASNSPAKVMSILQSAPMWAQFVGARVGDEDRDLTSAE